MKGWPTTSLAEVCHIRPPKSEAREKIKGNDLVSFLPMEDMGVNIKFVHATKARPLSEVAGSYTYFADGDVLLAKITPCFENGKLGIAQKLVNGIGFGSSEYMVFRPGEKLSNEWLYYYLSRESFRDEGASTMTGAVGHKRVSKEFVDSYSIPIPPLPEQHRIVTILDIAFANIATAKANTEKNLRNAREVFESYLDEVFAKGRWEEKQIGDIAIHSLGKMLDKAKNKGVLQPYLRNINVRWFTFDLSDLLQMPFLPNEKDKCRAIKGDVLICEGGYPGRAAIWEEDYPVYFQKALHRVRFHEKEYNKWFINYLYMQDKNGELKKHFSGTGIQHFTGQVLDRFMLPMPPLNKLRPLVANIEELAAESQRLVTLYQRKLAALEELKKSLLDQAFSGAL